jgi:hypothetical protein
MLKTKLLMMLIVWLSAAMVGAPSGLAQEGDAKARAEQLLKQAREALGGEAKRTAIQSFSAAGKYRRLMQGQSSEGEIAFDFLLPDKFLKTETRPLPTGDTMTSLRGLNGGQYFQDSISSNPTGPMMQTIPSGGPPSDPAVPLRAECARYLLAWLLTSSSALPLEFSYAGEAKTKAGQANVLAVKGPQGFAARLFLDPQTHRPLMLGYRGTARRPMMISGGSGMSVEEAIREAQRQAAQEVEIELWFSEFRAVDGWLLPHRIKQSAGGEEAEEWIMTKFQLNPPLKPEKFQKK